MYKSYSMELAGRTLTVDIGRVAAQANGAVFIKYGDTTVLSTATASDKPRDGVDFFPLSVEFEEKMYSVGKIPGGFNKREGKASENAILTDRVIDRPMRPLFPKDYRNDVTLNNLVMSVDPECRPEIVAMIGTALAVHISDIPFDGPCAMTQMGLVDGEFIVNPSQKQWDEGDLQLTVASTKEKVIMIEAGANEIPEDQMIEAIYKCHDINQTVIAFMDQIRDEIGKPKRDGIVQMVHQAGHPARAAAKFKYKRRPHNAPTNTGPKRDGFICVFHRADPTHDKVAHLTVQRHLQTVTNKAKRFFLQHDRLIANGCIERLCHSHRFISGLLSLGNFHQRDQVRRVIRMTADKAFRVLGIFGNFGHKQARSRAGNDCIR